MSILKEEFQMIVAPSQALPLNSSSLTHSKMVKEAYSASIAKHRADEKAEAEETGDFFFEMSMLQVTLEFQRHMQELSDRIDRLDIISLGALEEAQENLQQIRDNANRDIEGRHIYQSSGDGNIYYEDGMEVSENYINRADWREDVADYEALQMRHQIFVRARQFRTEVLEQKARLENNPNADDLDAIENELDLLASEFSDFISADDDLQKGSLLSSSFLLFWHYRGM